MARVSRAPIPLAIDEFGCCDICYRRGVYAEHAAVSPMVLGNAVFNLARSIGATDAADPTTPSKIQNDVCPGRPEHTSV